MIPKSPPFNIPLIIIPDLIAIATEDATTLRSIGVFVLTTAMLYSDYSDMPAVGQWYHLLCLCLLRRG